jgi:hypothetical protein
MEKGWPFLMTKHGHEDNSSCGGKKKEWDHCYVPINHARRLFKGGGCSVPWSDVNLHEGWILNSQRVLVPRERPNEFCRQGFILSLDMHGHPTFSIGFHNWHSFGSWEFDRATKQYT